MFVTAVAHQIEDLVGIRDVHINDVELTALALYEKGGLLQIIHILVGIMERQPSQSTLGL